MNTAASPLSYEESHAKLPNDELMQQAVTKVQALDLTMLKRKLIEEQGWTQEYCNEIEDLYRKFLALNIRHPDKKVCPTGPIDNFWHATLSIPLPIKKTATNYSGSSSTTFPTSVCAALKTKPTWKPPSNNPLAYSYYTLALIPPLATHKHEAAGPKDVPNMENIARTHFFDHKEDIQLDQRNLHFWRALHGHILADNALPQHATILDIGCHRGGLLELLIQKFNVDKVIGLDPLLSARKAAAQRLAHFCVDAKFYDTNGWQQVPNACASLVVAHEVFQYIEHLPVVMSHIKRVLQPGAFAYIVLGCHSENPLWEHWKRELEAIGHTAYNHAPFDILAIAANAGLAPSLRPLRDTGWVYYKPDQDDAFTYPSAAALLEHQYKQKLLFRLENPL